jgi:hypothetical protein
VALDGPKMHANASRHSALSYEHAGKLAAPLKAEAAVLLATAEAAVLLATAEGGYSGRGVGHSTAMKQNATESYVARSSFRLENTPVASP